MKPRRSLQRLLGVLVWVFFSLTLVRSAPAQGQQVTVSPEIGAESGLFVPADCDLAAGPDHVVVTDNYQIHVFPKSGWNPPNSTSTTFALNGVTGFFSAFFAAPEPGHPVFDPRVIYDAFDNRYWIVAMHFFKYDPDLNPVSDMYFDIAVSATGDPAGTWHKYSEDADAWCGGIIINESVLDFPNIAVDDDYLYISAWMVTQFRDPTIWESPVWIVRKQELMENQPPAQKLFQSFVADDYKKYNHKATPAPVLRPDPTDAGPMYFVGVDPGNAGGVFYPNGNEPQGTTLNVQWNEITLHAIRIENNQPFLFNHHLAVPSTYQIARNTEVQQPGSELNRNLRLLSARFWATPVFRDGYLWAAHHVRNPSTAMHEVRWYLIDMNEWTEPAGGIPVLVDWGTITPAQSTNHAMFPSIGVNATLDMVVAHHEVRKHSTPSLNQKPAIRRFLLPWTAESGYYAWIKNDADVGIHEPDDGESIVKWGDFSGTEADPSDVCTFWTYHMWAEGGDLLTWRTWLHKNTLPEICTTYFGPDYSGNGVVDAEDAILFSEFYTTRSHRADYNRDRVVDELDLAAFLEGLARGTR